MFAKRENLSTAALSLVLLLAGGTPALAREGVWVYPGVDGWMSISLVNLTDYPLLITKNDVEVWASLSVEAWYQSTPFAGSGELNLAPYRTATWRSVATSNFERRGAYAWHKQFSVLPQGMDPKWTVTVDMHTADASGSYLGKGTWVCLRVSDDPLNTEWGPYYYTSDPAGTFFYGGWHYGVWATPIAAGSSVLTGLYNVMTVSGNLLAVSLYSPDNSNLTLVVRQTNWDGSQVDDYTGWQLDFVDNNTGTMP